MHRVKACCGFVCLAALAAGPDARLKPVEDHYNNARSLTADFEQRLLVKGRMPRIESGRLVMLKPRRMRFDYAQPSGKFFLSDGKWAYYYSPAANRVEKARLKESEDYRTPLALLLGRLKFTREFDDILIKDTAEGFEVTASPKNRSFEFDEAVFTIGKDNAIVRLRLMNPDNSIMEFNLRNERLNAPVGEAIFQFIPPPGAEMVEVKTFGVD